MNFNGYNIISGNAKVVRSVNRAVILNIIREKHPISRVEIARLIGLNKSTVSSIVSDLLAEDLIEEQVHVDNQIGRNPISLRLKLGKHFIGAINISSSITRFAITDIDGRLLGRGSTPAKKHNPKKFVELCMRKLYKLKDQLKIPELAGMGVSTAGIVDPENLIVKFAPNLGWEQFNIGDVLNNSTTGNCVIAVDNDAKSSALAELWFGTHEINLSNFVFLSIGQGIGAGIVVERNLLNGEFQASGEFGHMTIFEGGERCSCGNKGCWEAYASDLATVRQYEAAAKNSGSNSYGVMLQDIIDLAAQKDELAVKILKKKGFYLGLGISNIIKALDPKAIVIGGKVLQVWDLIYPEIIETVQKRAFFGKERDIKILPTSLKERPRLLGAAALAIRKLFRNFKVKP